MAMDKDKEAEKLWKKAGKLCMPNLFDFRIKPDWEAACPLFEKAALLWKQANNLERSKQAYDKASTAQERMGSAWHAAKHMETCGDLAKQLEQWEEVALYFKRASQLYLEGGKGPTGADALGRGAKMLEQKDPAVALGLYEDAIVLYESEGKEAQGNDIYRQAIALTIKQRQFDSSIALLLKMGAACETWNAKSSQCKAYLGAVVVALHAGQWQHAWSVFQDCLLIDAFVSSEEAFCADALLEAYRSGRPDAVRKVVQEKHSLKNLDHMCARLAVALPGTGDVEAAARVLKGVTGMDAGDSSEGGDGGGDEDLT